MGHIHMSEGHPILFFRPECTIHLSASHFRGRKTPQQGLGGPTCDPNARSTRAHRTFGRAERRWRDRVTATPTTTGNIAIASSAVPQHCNRVVGSTATSQSRRRQHHDCNRIARSTAARSRCRQHHSRTAGDTSPHRRQHRSRAVEGHRGSTGNCAAITPSTKPLLLSHDTDRGRKHRRPHSRGSPPA